MGKEVVMQTVLASAESALFDEIEKILDGPLGNANSDAGRRGREAAAK